MNTAVLFYSHASRLYVSPWETIRTFINSLEIQKYFQIHIIWDIVFIKWNNVSFSSLVIKLLLEFVLHKNAFLTNNYNLSNEENFFLPM